MKIIHFLVDTCFWKLFLVLNILDQKILIQEANGPDQEAEEEEEGGSRQREARRGEDPPQEHGSQLHYLYSLHTNSYKRARLKW